MMMGTWIASHGVPLSTGAMGCTNGSMGSRSSSSMTSADMAEAL